MLARVEQHQSMVKRLIEMAGLSKIASDPLANLTRVPFFERYPYRLRPLPEPLPDDHRQLILDAVREIAIPKATWSSPRMPPRLRSVRCRVSCAFW